MTQDSFLQRACPGCASSRRAAAPKVSSRPAAEAATLAEIARDWELSGGKRVFFSYYRCEGCGLLYCPVTLTREQSVHLYRGMSDNSHGVAEPGLRRTQEGYLDILRRNGELAGDYLEIGPDVGLLAQSCLRAGELGAMHLFEPNRTVHDALRANLTGADLRLHPSMFDASAVADGSISLAVAVHVVDHLLEPAAVASQLRRKLVSGGRLLIVVHDESSLLSKVAGTRWPPYCLGHPQLFSPSSLSALLERTGLRVEAVEKTVNHFPLGHLLEHAAKALGARIQAPAVLHRPLVSLRLGNIAAVATAP